MIRFRFVDDPRDVHNDVSRMCALVELPRPSFYAWPAGFGQARKAADAAIEPPEHGPTQERLNHPNTRTRGWILRPADPRRRRSAPVVPIICSRTPRIAQEAPLAVLGRSASNGSFNRLTGRYRSGS